MMMPFINTTADSQKNNNMQHPAFPRGPPPQYYLDPREFNFAVRMGSGDPPWCGRMCL